MSVCLPICLVAFPLFYPQVFLSTCLYTGLFTCLSSLTHRWRSNYRSLYFGSIINLFLVAFRKLRAIYIAPHTQSSIPLPPHAHTHTRTHTRTHAQRETFSRKEEKKWKNTDTRKHKKLSVLQQLDYHKYSIRRWRIRFPWPCTWPSPTVGVCVYSLIGADAAKSTYAP